MKGIIAIALAAVLLSGCLTPAAVAFSVALQVREVYCEGTSDTGKEAVRAKLTAGQQVVACPEK